MTGTEKRLSCGWPRDPSLDGDLTMLLRAVLVPLGGLCIGLGVLIGGNVGKGLIATGTVLFGAATVLTLTD